MNRIILFGWILIIISSCNRNVKVQNGLDDIPFIINCDMLIHQPEEGIDSKIGTIICDDISLSYDYGLYCNSKPESMIESFSKSFYAYHYSKFFDAIFLDEKLRETFKDSVQITKVIKEMVDDKYIINCNECNATAYLVFNDITFLYPFIMNDKIVNNHRIFDISHTRLNDYYKKTYLTKEDLTSGVYIAPLGKPTKNRMKMKLNVTTTQLPSPLLIEILESIELK